MIRTRGPAAVTAAAVLVTGAGQAGPRDAAQGGPQLASTGTVVNYPSGHGPRLPSVPASAFVIADAGTGQVLAARDPHGWFRPASTLKVLTAITLIPVLNPDATTVASHQAATVDPNDVGLITGKRYKIADLFRALLTISANDAAVALAQATGSFRRGLQLMNAEAHELQADDTVAKEPNGLDARGQHTSAYDEALIARRALAVPAFLKYDRTLAARFELKPRHWVTLVNQNQMLTSYPGDIGGKIGWTSAAGATYMAMARRHRVTLIVTILKCRPLAEFTAAARLLDWGFATDGKVRPVGTLVSPLPPPGPGKPKKPAPARGTGAATAVRHPAAASSGLPGAPIAGGIGLLLAAGLTAAALLTRRRRRSSAS
jgi:D-alanyl-D-alanine carboxypeptidase (penicillin-binding protein 5/6)